MPDSGGPACDLPVLLRLQIQGTPDAVSAALQALFAGPDRLALPADTGSDAQIVLAEAMNNIVEHAYADRDGLIDVTLWAAPDGLLCRLVDNGAPMPSVLPGGSLPPSGPDDGLPEGGFGWFLIRALASDIVSQRRDGMNHLTFSIPAKRSPAAARDCARCGDGATNRP